MSTRQTLTEVVPISMPITHSELVILQYKKISEYELIKNEHINVNIFLTKQMNKT